MEAKKCMEEIQTEIDRDGISDSIYAKEADAKTRYLKAMQNYEKLWAEKSRSRWRDQGDRCSKLFHISVKMRRMKNSIKSLKMDDGTLPSDKAQIKEYVSGYYEHFHKGAPLTTHIDLLQCIPNVLEEWDRGRLDGIPSDTEIKGTVWDLDPDSAPGLDGFPGAFYKSCWDIISSDVCKAIRWFFRTDFMPCKINNNFLVLIPKIEGALSLDKFRPLCMGIFFCKIISKVLAMRLSCVLPKIISEEGAFQKGKIIHSNISLASELANMMFASTRGGGMGLKIDIPKAFDTISWNFIFHVLRRFGFSEKWISWIHQILTFARILVLLNGGPVGYFGVEKGLRQGDPISPMLFIIAEEVLCRGLSELLANNNIKALSGPRGATIPTHILFSDDVFIFSNASIRKLGMQTQRAPPQSILEIFWCRPEVNWIKLNFDESSRGNPGRVGAGGIFRDHKGGVLESYKIFMGVSEVFEDEVEGLMVGLMRARELGITCLWVETDSSAVAISIQQKKIPWFALQRWIFL
ncbi:uncharacterized protein LOC122079360 [Macadamia integrifolia]|uniref:uncharacterized protein LOC122079360 n=1 Tax=Macadamia integrifolia TaxID=60698 RepID=UPI001C4EABF6|nr:uncharacterized protein LOC122079360 [Macadamia integrifolia]